MKRLFSIVIMMVAMACLNGHAQEWKPAGDRIMSRWAAQVDPEMPLPEYPRPQMVRGEWKNLNGLWDYAITDASASGFESEGKILVPFCAESALSGVGLRVGKENALWYEREFTVPKAWRQGTRIMLHFGAVDWKTDVWVNDIHVGQHTGGYAPFSYDVTDALKKSSKQILRVRVWDATDDSFQPRGKQLDQPHGIWYTAVTGIWQTVWLEPVDARAHINSYHAVSDKKGNLTVKVEADGLQSGDCIRVSLVEGGIGYSPENPGSVVISEKTGSDVVFTLDKPQLWSPENPYLYGLRIAVERDGKVVDVIDGYTALRYVSMIKDHAPDNRTNAYCRIGLNGKRLFNFGPLDQGWWPDGLYTAPTDDALKFDIVKTKDWGWNTIRKHIKVEPARWYYWCDVLGMMVWQDMPIIGDHGHGKIDNRSEEIKAANRNVWAKDSFIGGTDTVVPQEWKDNFYKEWKEIIMALRHFQCITIWVPFNEAWGQFDTPQVVDFTRKLDGTRLINESSGGNFSFSGDIVDVHHYACPAMNAFEAKKINVLGEYGGLGMALEGHLWQKNDNKGYGKLFKDSASMLKVYSDFAERLKVFVSTGCAGAIYTQTTDVEGEINGIMTYDRDVVKFDEAELKTINVNVIESLE